MSIINSHPLFLSSSAADMALEIWASLRFFFAFLRGDPNARGNSKMKAADTRGKDFGEAFGVAPPAYRRSESYKLGRENPPSLGRRYTPVLEEDEERLTAAKLNTNIARGDATPRSHDDESPSSAESARDW